MVGRLSLPADALLKQSSPLCSEPADRFGSHCFLEYDTARLDLFDSILLLSPFNTITTGVAFGPTSVTTVPRVPATIGSRFYVQAIVGNPSTGNLTLTNSVVLTTN